jgi:hypothetical protein
VRIGEEDLPPCRLCFVNARTREIERCRLTIDPDDIEDRLLRRLWRAGEPAAVETLVAFALRAPSGSYLRRPASTSFRKSIKPRM